MHHREGFTQCRKPGEWGLTSNNHSLSGSSFLNTLGVTFLTSWRQQYRAGGPVAPTTTIFLSSAAGVVPGHCAIIPRKERPLLHRKGGLECLMVLTGHEPAGSCQRT